MQCSKNRETFKFSHKNIWLLFFFGLSLPSLSSNWIELWCNGNTADFGSVVSGSNPDSSTEGEDLFKVAPFFYDVPEGEIGEVPEGEIGEVPEVR